MDAERRLRELAGRAARTGMTCFSAFLDPSEFSIAQRAAREEGAVCCLNGGWSDAERRMAGFLAMEEDTEWPIAALLIRWNPKFGDIGHRDLFGAVMALGLERDGIGDLCLGEASGTAYLFVQDALADYVSANLTEAGRASLRVSRADAPFAIAPPSGELIRVTVQQPRLDAVLAAGWKLSRSEAQRAIQQGLVKLDHVVETRSDVRVDEGSMISLRGSGRIWVREVQGETRRGRLGMLLFRTAKQARV